MILMLCINNRRCESITTAAVKCGKALMAETWPSQNLLLAEAGTQWKLHPLRHRFPCAKLRLQHLQHKSLRNRAVTPGHDPMCIKNETRRWQARGQLLHQERLLGPRLGALCRLLRCRVPLQTLPRCAATPSFISDHRQRRRRRTCDRGPASRQAHYICRL